MISFHPFGGAQAVGASRGIFNRGMGLLPPLTTVVFVHTRHHRMPNTHGESYALS